jgi:phage shock protein PspC (stress-responsive transcriptional regulator)
MATCHGRHFQEFRPVTDKPNLFLRQDTLLGACQGIADDLGIDALWLRVPLATSILFDPRIAFGAYALMCVLVFATRMIWPVKTKAVVASKVAAETEAAPVAVADNEQRELAQAA